MIVAVTVDAVLPGVQETLHAVIEDVAAENVDTVRSTGPGDDVATNRTGLPVKPLDVASTVSFPTVWLSVQEVTVATPVPPVDCVPPVTVPLNADVAANVTEMLETPLPARSVTFTDGAGATAVLTVPLTRVALFDAMVVALPGFAVALNDTGDPDGTLALACTV